MKVVKLIIECIVLIVLWFIAFPFRVIGLILSAIVGAFKVGYHKDMNKLLKD